MRGRWASAALGAGIARHRAGREMEQQQQAFDTQQQQALIMHETYIRRRGILL
jgi:hypothetical protein